MDDEGVQAFLNSLGLSTVLDKNKLDAVMKVPRTHKSQPLAWLVRGLSNPLGGGNAHQVAHNSVVAIRNLDGPPYQDWLQAKMPLILSTTDFSDASATLAEIRALADLAHVLSTVDTIPCRPDVKTPEFGVKENGAKDFALYVEVVSKRQRQGQRRLPLLG